MDDDDIKRFWRKVDKGRGKSNCWNWLGAKSRSGYDTFNRSRRSPRGTMLAHRISLEIAGRPVPAGLVADHICRNPGCVNPDHLEAVTNRENTLRGTAGRHRIIERVSVNHCANGHPFDHPNTYWFGKWRQCKACKADHVRRKRAQSAALLAGGGK